MEPLFLTEYIKSPLFMEELKKTKNFGRELLLTDFDFEEELPFQSCICHHDADTNVVDYWEQLIHRAEDVLVILSAFSPSFIKKLAQKYAEKMTLIDLYHGMGSEGRKIKGEKFDFPIRDFFEVYDPVDRKNFIDILQNTTGNALITIPLQLFEDDIFHIDEIRFVDQENLKFLTTLSLVEYGYLGNEATLLGTGSQLPLLLQIGDLLKEQQFGVDIFGITKFSAWNRENILRSFEKNKKIFFVIDEEYPEILLQDLKEYADKHQYQLLFLTPKYEKITTIFEEYYKEQAKFDADHLAQRILAS